MKTHLFGLETSQKCQQSQGFWWVVVPKRRTVIAFGLACCPRISKVSTVTGIGAGCGRETQNCRCFWTRLRGHMDWGGSWSRNAELSLLLDSPVVLASQKCQQSQGLGWVVVAKRRTVVAFGLACCPRISKGSNVTGMVAKRRTIVAFGFACCPRISKVSTVTGIGAGCGRETQNCFAFGLVSCRRASRRRISKVSTMTSGVQCLRFLQKVLRGCESGF